MSEQEIMVDDEQEVDVPANQQNILDFLKQIEDGDFTNAERNFNSMVGDKITDVLDQTKMKLADQIFNGYDDVEDEESDEDVELEIDDEEIENELEDDEEDLEYEDEVEDEDEEEEDDSEEEPSEN